MKYKLTVNHQTYEVKIENINARPVAVTVDGQRFEVMPENEKQVEVNPEAGAGAESKPLMQMPIPTSNPSAGGSQTLTAPLPGTVIELFVKPGEKVEVGQVVLVIEAMKMKNSIRSTREGKVAAVLVSAGQTVTHKQSLLEFE